MPAPSTPPTPNHGEASLLQRHLSAPRLSTYLHASSGDLQAALALYRWNTAAAGAYWQVLGHLEVFLRNAIHEPLAARHARLDRPGQWFEDPAGELDQRARDDVAIAVRRLRRAGAPILPGKVIAELPFGFWRFLLAKRYTASLWPVIRPTFAHMPRGDRRLVEVPIAGLHQLRNRVAHHEPLIHQPLQERYDDLLTVVSYLDPSLRKWVDTYAEVSTVLACRPPAPAPR